MTIGIYCFENLYNGKKYIGKSLNIEERTRAHKRLLNRGVHENVHLQRAWKKWGEDNFSICIVEQCKKERLVDLECFYIAKFDSKKNGYNLTDGGEGSPGRIISEDTRVKMSSSKIGIKRKPFTEETLEKMRIAQNKERFISEETRLKMAESARLRKQISEETRNKLITRNITRWRKYREENNKEPSP